ncbi:MAG: hypothetical protein UDF83_05130 [Collinsella stercoris]|nr:hypothetical protein [Collinsella stercoris]
MARRNKHDAQVDPFTAGEPTLPWDESPSPFGENDQAVEECAFGDEPYDGPTKEPDNYNAPAADEEQEPVTSIDPMYLRKLFSLSKNGEQDGGSKKTVRRRHRTRANKAGGPSAHAGDSSPVGASAHAVNSGSTRDSDPVGPSASARASRRQDTKRRAKSNSGNRGTSKTSTSRRTAIRTIIFVILFFNVAPIACTGAISLLDAFDSRPSVDASHDEPAHTPSDNDLSSDDTAESPEESPDDIAKQKCLDIAAARLNEVSSADGPERERIVAFLNTYFVNSLGYTTEELGIDADAFAVWALQNFSYEIESCYVHTDEGTAAVYFNVWCPSASTIANTADEAIFDRLYQEIDFFADVPEPLTDAQKDQVRALFAEALDDSWQDDPGFSCIDFVFEDGEWKADEDSFADEMDLVLGIW